MVESPSEEEAVFSDVSAVFVVVDDGVMSVVVDDTPVVVGNPAFVNSWLTALLKATLSNCFCCVEVYVKSALIPAVDNLRAPSFSRRQPT
eukprot:CAMPEP_0172910668 /NCGR_PEP_ID=MMETSP1075-20121228/185095_1 /TAXON_ID=2916 /ORGANISM="Ceratium fusus, Strain PA161109" /LENGTH=89 /DNA_ID=CAMNT_0013768843 /DNA_START=187 /DNA_END=452 /DNA_ORIENTATION=+